MPCWCDSEALILGKHAYAIQITPTSPVLIGIQDVDGLATGATIRTLCDLHEVILRGVYASLVPPKDEPVFKPDHIAVDEGVLSFELIKLSLKRVDAVHHRAGAGEDLS